MLWAIEKHSTYISTGSISSGGICACCGRIWVCRGGSPVRALSAHVELVKYSVKLPTTHREQLAHLNPRIHAHVPHKELPLAAVPHSIRPEEVHDPPDPAAAGGSLIEHRGLVLRTRLEHPFHHAPLRSHPEHHPNLRGREHRSRQHRLTGRPAWVSVMKPNTIRSTRESLGL